MEEKEKINKPRGPKRTKVQRINHKKEIAEMYLKGMTQWEIGKELGISRQQVGFDLKALYEEWKERYIEDVANLKAVELRKLDTIEQELWRLYELSKQDGYRKTTRTIAKPSKTNEDKNSKAIIKQVEAYETTTKNIGDVAILDRIMKLIEQRSRLLGLETIKIDLNHSGTLTLEQQVKQMSDDELIRIIQIDPI